MSNPNTQGNTKPPDYAKLYQQGINIDLKNLPKELQAELANRQQYDPAYTQQALDLQHQFDPQLASEQMAALQRRDPQWLAIHQGLGDKVQEALQRGYVDPQQAQAYKALGQTVTSDQLRGPTASPAALKDIIQAIQSRQPGLSYGEAQDMATAVYTGQRGQQLQQQRQQATNQYLQQISPEQNAMALAGTYMQPSNSVTGQINQIQGVTPPSANRYVNPNAGSQDVQFGLSNYQNQLASNQLSGGGNPWTNALQGASTGASYGSIGGVYGAAGGAITGAVGGALGYPQYSDSRLKNNISRTGVHTKDGIELVEFDMFGRRYKGGVIAQETQQIRPDVVGMMNGYMTVDYAKLGIETPQACDALPCRAGPGIAGPSPSQPSLSSNRDYAGQKSTEREVE